MKGHRFHVGQLLVARPADRLADFGDAILQVTQVLPSDKVRIRRANDTFTQDLIVPGSVVMPYQPHARGTDPDTSHAAARAQTAERLTAGQRAALRALAVAGDQGLTDFELADATGVKQTSSDKRRGELVRRRLAVNSGDTRWSDTKTPSVVWRVTAAGVDAWRADLGAAS